MNNPHQTPENPMKLPWSHHEVTIKIPFQGGDHCKLPPSVISREAELRGTEFSGLSRPLFIVTIIIQGGAPQL